MLLACDKKEVRGAILTTSVMIYLQLNAYEFDPNTLMIFSPEYHKKLNVPRGSISASVLFNIKLCDFFLSKYSSEFTNFADNTNPYVYGKSYDDVPTNMKQQIETLFG